MEKKKKNKVLAWLIPVVVIVIIIALIAVFSVQKKEEEVIKIGVILPLTGKAAYLGEVERIGLEIAKKHLNFDQKNIRLILEDFGSDPNKAMTAAKKLIEVDNVNALICYTTLACSAIADYVESKHIPMFTETAASIYKGRDFLFSNYYETERMSEILGRILGKKFNKIGILYNVDLPVVVLFKDSVEKGIKSVNPNAMIISVSYSSTDRDWKTQLLKLKSQNVEVFAIFEYMSIMKLINKQRKELGLHIPMASIVKKIQAINVSEWDGIITVEPCMKELHPIALEIKEKTNMPYFAMIGYEDLSILSQIFEKGIRRGEEIKDYLMKNEFDPVFLCVDKIRFNEEGHLIQQPYFVYESINGSEFKLVETA